MSCKQPVFTIFTGNAKRMNLKASYAGSNDPLDLTDCTEIDVAILNTGGSFSHFLLSLDEVTIKTPMNLGKFYVDIGSVASALFNVGELQSFDVTFTINGLPQTVRYYSQLSVFQNT